MKGINLFQIVYYVLNMKSNIFSLYQLFEKGYDIHMKDYSLFIRDDKGKLITKVKTKNRTFSLNIKLMLQSI